jgi:hypothetical protein
MKIYIYSKETNDLLHTYTARTKEACQEFAEENFGGGGYSWVFKNPAAVALGKIKTAKASAASRENGKLGGRPGDPFRKTLRNAGMKWYWTANKQLRIYITATRPEWVGTYDSWETARKCRSLLQTIQERG